MPKVNAEIAVQFGTRISLPVRELIDEVSRRDGIKIREVVEQAIRAQYGDRDLSELANSEQETAA